MSFFFIFAQMDAITRDGNEFPVSVWMKKVGSDGDHRVIVVIEPVARCSAKFELDHKVNELNFTVCYTSFITIIEYDHDMIIIYYHKLQCTCKI